VLGHSLGGVVALALATARYPVPVRAVISLGIKVAWTDEDLNRALAMDAAGFAVGAPDMADLLAHTQSEVTLARGERDPMNTDEQLVRLGVATVTLPGLGHNAQVEDPERSIALLGPYR
jgi:pimeloyl-ACP methyl ester carboxylesterase